MTETNAFGEQVEALLRAAAGKAVERATAREWYEAVSTAAMTQVAPTWKSPHTGRRAAYFSAEFLIGRMVYANLLNMGLLKETEALLRGRGIDVRLLEEIEDAALGNGGLGRLAACFLDSAATQGIPLDGYGIRYRYGLFRQSFREGFQQEAADDWLRFGDPWSRRCDADAVLVTFAGQTVRAVPYDMPVIGYGGQTINNLRLWQAEAVTPMDFTLFNSQQYDAALKQRNDAEAITMVLYPNDDGAEGKKLRLKQQYFFTSASLQDMLRRFREEGGDPRRFAETHAIQLNDTHPTVAIPELIRLLTEGGELSFEEAFAVARDTFAYTNHTVLPEALETWDVTLFRLVLPHIYPVIKAIDDRLKKELPAAGLRGEEARRFPIIDGDTLHMARLAVYATHSTNGVARLHTEILKTSVLAHWYRLFPERFSNKTNGVTQRRWLALANPGLSSLITDTIGDGWITDLEQLSRLEPYARDGAFMERFREIKRENKRRLADYIVQKEGLSLRADFLLDVQVKRLHEYKRQLLNALSILDTYYRLKEGALADFMPTAYLFGGKAAPGYIRAKAIIKVIHEVARLVNSDSDMHDRMQVVYVTNYDVSYAEKIIPAADVSEQISTAGTEASGTGNMKMMMNGAVTLGTYDGANVEIAERVGEENIYICGDRVEQLASRRQAYRPQELYESDPRLRRVIDALTDGTLDDGGTGWFAELRAALLEGASWHAPDPYFLLEDFRSYCDTRDRINRDSRDANEFSRKGLINTARSGIFSSDRTIAEYARDIWRI